MKAFVAAAGLWITPALTAAQSSPAPAEPATAARPTAPEDMLDPGDYAAAFNSGAQTEFVGLTSAISSLLVGYDAVFMQFEVSLGLGIGDVLPREDPAPRDVYVASLRVALPVHRGIRADYSILLAGGATFFDTPGAKLDVIGSLGAGARFRAFFSPNIALAGTLGMAVFFGGGSTSVVVGARPLGAAGVMYFFR